MFNEQAKPEGRTHALAAVGGAISHSTRSGVHLVKLTGDVMQAAAKLKRDPSVRFVSPNYITHVSSIDPNDPLRGQQWAIPRTGADQAWANIDSSNPLPEVRVAVMDTGITATHPDLVNRIRLDLARNFTEDALHVVNPTDVHDGQGHGTHVAGTFAAEANNSLGTAGIAGLANVKVIPLKVLNDNGGGSTGQTIEALDYLLGLPESDRPAIINMSFGCGGCYSEAEAYAISKVTSAGMLVIAAAGNESQDTANTSPAGLPGVVTVAALDQLQQSDRTHYQMTAPWQDARSSFSNWGSEVDVIAPGSWILAPEGKGTAIWDGYDVDGYRIHLIDDPTNSGSTYAFLSGTSMATPVTVGVAALIKEFHPNYTRHQLLAHLLETAQPSSQGDSSLSGWSSDFGFGVVNAARAAETLPGSVFQKWALKVERPFKGRQLSGVTDLAVDVDTTLVDQVVVSTDDPTVPAVSDWWWFPEGPEIWRATLDTTRLRDGAHTLTFTAYSHGIKVTEWKIPVTVDNGAPTSGLHVKVQTPDGLPASSWWATVLKHHDDGTYELVGDSVQTDPNGDVVLTGQWAVDGTQYDVIVDGMWFDYVTGQPYTVQYHRTTVAPALVLMDGANVRPVRATVSSTPDRFVNGGVRLAPVDRNGKSMSPIEGPAFWEGALASEQKPNAAPTSMAMLLEPGTYNFAFQSFADPNGTDPNGTVPAYLTQKAVVIPSGSLASEHFSVNFSTADTAEVRYIPSTEGAKIMAQPDDGLNLAGGFELVGGSSFLVSKGRYIPIAYEYVPSSTNYSSYGVQGAPVDWVNTSNLSVGHLNPLSITLSTTAAVPGQKLRVLNPFTTDTNMTLIYGFSIPVTTGVSPQALMPQNTSRLLPPAKGQYAPRFRPLPKNQKLSGAVGPVAMLTPPQPTSGMPYLRIKSDLDGSLLAWQSYADVYENEVQLPTYGLPGPYTVEVGVTGLGPIMGSATLINGTAPLTFGNTLASGMRIRVIEPDSVPGNSMVALYRKITQGTQTVYRWVTSARTRSDGTVVFDQLDPADYTVVAIPFSVWSGDQAATRYNYMLISDIRLRGDIVLDARTAVPFSISVNRPDGMTGWDQSGVYGTLPGGPIAGQGLYLTPFDTRGTGIGTFWVGATSNGSAGVYTSTRPAGSQLFWLTPGDYKVTTIDNNAVVQLSSPDKFSVRTGSVNSYTIPYVASKLGSITINAPSYDLNPTARGTNLGWRAYIRPVGTFFPVSWRLLNYGPSMTLPVTPGQYEVWTEWIQGATTQPSWTPDHSLMRQWTYLMSSPTVSVAAGRPTTVRNGGNFQVQLTSVTADKTRARATVSITDSYSNTLRGVALWDESGFGEVLPTVAQDGQQLVNTAGRWEFQETMKEPQLAKLLGPSGFRAIKSGSVSWTSTGDVLNPSLQLTDPTYQSSIIKDSDPSLWYGIDQLLPQNLMPGTYSVNLTLPLSSAGPVTSNPIYFGVAGTGADNIKVMNSRFTPGGRRSVTALYNPVAAGTVTFGVVDESGKVVRMLGVRNAKLGDSPFSVEWNGRDDRGRLVPNGTYKIVASRSGKIAADSVKVSLLGLTTAIADGPLYLGSSYPVTATVSTDVPTGVQVSIVTLNGNDETLVSTHVPGPSFIGPAPVWQPFYYTWDGTDDSGALVPPGQYFFKFTNTADAEQSYYLEFNAASVFRGVGLTMFGSTNSFPVFAADGVLHPSFLYVDGLGKRVKASIVDMNGVDLGVLGVGTTVTDPDLPPELGLLVVPWNGKLGDAVPPTGIYRLKMQRVDSYGKPTTDGPVFTTFGMAPFKIGDLTVPPTFTPKLTDPTAKMAFSIAPLSPEGSVIYTVKILSAAGAEIRTLVKPADLNKATAWLWDGKNSAGKYAPDGHYQVVVTSSLFPKNPLTAGFDIVGTTIPAPAANPVPGYVTDKQYKFTGTAIPGATLLFTLDNRPVTVVVAGVTKPFTVQADGNGTWQAQLPVPMTEVAHKLQVAQVDPVTGFTSALTTAIPFTVDATKPTLTLTTPSFAATNLVRTVTVNKGTYQVVGLASDVGIPVSLYVDGAQVPTMTVKSGKDKKFIFNVPLTDGPHTMTLDAIDLAGNQGDKLPLFTVVVDTVTPEVLSTTLLTGTLATPGAPVLPVETTYDSRGNLASVRYITNAKDLLFSAEFSEAVTVAGVTGSVTTFGKVLAAQTPGTKTISIAGSDAAGNRMNVLVTIVIDATGPAVVPPPFAVSVNQQGASKPLSFTFNSNEPLDVSSVELHRRDYAGTTTTGEGVVITPAKVSLNKPGTALTVQISPQDMGDGQYQYGLRVKDLAGNSSVLVWTGAVTIDTAAPAVTLNQPASLLLSSKNLTVSGQVTGGATSVRLNVLGTSSITFSPTANPFSFSRSVALKDDAVNTISAVATDALGNTSEGTDAAQYQVLVKTSIKGAYAQVRYSGADLVFASGRTDRPIFFNGTRYAVNHITVYAGSSTTGAVIYDGELAVNDDGTFTLTLQNAPSGLTAVTIVVSMPMGDNQLQSRSYVLTVAQ